MFVGVLDTSGLVSVPSLRKFVYLFQNKSFPQLRFFSSHLQKCYLTVRLFFYKQHFNKQRQAEIGKK